MKRILMIFIIIVIISIFVYLISFLMQQPSEDLSEIASVLRLDKKIKTIEACSTDGTIEIPIKGKINVMTFQYTRCPDICHLESGVLVRLMNRVIARGLEDKIVFVTIGVDPWNDTIDSVRSYMRNVAGEDLNRVRWVWVLDNVENMKRIWWELKIVAIKDNKTGLVTHTAGFYIFDESGKWVYVVQANVNSFRDLDRMANGLWRLIEEILRD